MLDQDTKNIVPTIEEKIKAKSRLIGKWEEANPGLSWFDSEINEDEPKIFITKELLESKAYRSLSKAAMLIYQDFLAKRVLKQIRRKKEKIWVIVNNGELIYPYLEAEKKGLSRQTFSKAISELQQKGLIDITHRGKGGRKPAKGTGDVTTYMMDTRWRDYETDDFRPPRKLKVKDTRQDRGFALLMSDPVKRKAILKKRRPKNAVSSVNNHTRIALTSVNNHTS